MDTDWLPFCLPGWQLLMTQQQQGSNKAHGSNTGSAATAAGSGGMSMNTIIENLPELWSEHQYEEEYDLGNFVQALKK